MLHPITNGIFVKMYDDAAQGRFINKTQGGILIAASARDQANVDRWAQVLSIGPDVTAVVPGDWVMIESGYWTEGFEHNGERAWKTDEDHLVMVSDEPVSIYGNDSQALG